MNPLIKFAGIVMFLMLLPRLGCAQTPTITTVAGESTSVFGGDGGPATAAGLSHPAAVALDLSGNFYITDGGHACLRKVSSTGGVISSIAGTPGVTGYSGDGLAATLAQIFNPTFIAINPSGDIVFCDSGNAVLRKVSSTGGVISTIAGNFSLGAGFSGDGGAATAARIGSNCTFCFDAAGNMFISDGDNHCIRKVSSAGGMITTIAGTPGVPGFAGDGGMADTAMFNHPAGIAIDASGNLYVADAGNNVLRKVSSTGGVITTIAGTPMVAGFSGDGAAATAAKLHHPYGVAVTSSGSEIFLADQANSRMRYISSTGSIFTVVGTAIAGFNGDGACATTEIDSPQGVCIDTLHNCYIADRNNNRIRYIDYHLEVYRVSEQSVVDLYPNPSDGHITLTVRNTLSNYSIKVSDVTGRLVLATTGYANTPTELQIPNAAGIYFVHVSGNGIDEFQKLVVAH